MGGLFLALVVATGGPAGAWQFNSVNQWFAPHGVVTFVLTNPLKILCPGGGCSKD